MSNREVVVVHSSDLHIDQPAGRFRDPERPRDALHWLREVIQTAQAAQADVVLLTGDVFEHNRQSLVLLERTARLLADAALPVVILPGNHDPLTPDSVYHRGGLADPPNVHVLGVSVDESLVFPELQLEVWGRAHLDYSDMSPLRDPRPRTTRWQIATAHGHFQPNPLEPGRFYGSWLIREEEIAATGADYVALGHWNRAAHVGNGRVPAYYSGSPEYTGTVNLVRLTTSGDVLVTREALLAGEQ